MSAGATTFYTERMARKPLSAQVIQKGDQRYVETIYCDGEILRTLVDPNQEPKRRPRRPFARVIDYSKPKEVKACRESAIEQMEANERLEICASASLPTSEQDSSSTQGTSSGM